MEVGRRRIDRVSSLNFVNHVRIPPSLISKEVIHPTYMGVLKCSRVSERAPVTHFSSLACSDPSAISPSKLDTQNSSPPTSIPASKRLSATGQLITHARCTDLLANQRPLLPFLHKDACSHSHRTDYHNDRSHLRSHNRPRNRKVRRTLVASKPCSARRTWAGTVHFGAPQSELCDGGHTPGSSEFQLLAVACARGRARRASCP